MQYYSNSIYFKCSMMSSKIRKESKLSKVKILTIPRCDIYVNSGASINVLCSQWYLHQNPCDICGITYYYYRVCIVGSMSPNQKPHFFIQQKKEMQYVNSIITNIHMTNVWSKYPGLILTPLCLLWLIMMFSLSSFFLDK